MLQAVLCAESPILQRPSDARLQGPINPQLTMTHSNTNPTSGRPQPKDIPRHLVANPDAATEALLYMPSTDVKKAHQVLTNMIQARCLFDIRYLPDSGAFHTRLGQPFGTRIKERQIGDAVVVPASQMQPLVTPDVLRVRINSVPAAMFLHIQDALKGCPKALSALDKHVRFGSSQESSGLLENVWHVRSLVKKSTLSRGSVTIIASVRSAKHWADLIDNGVLFNGPSLQVWCAAIPYFDSRDVSAAHPMQKRRELAFDALRRKVNAIAPTFADELPFWYPEFFLAESSGTDGFSVNAPNPEVPPKVAPAINVLKLDEPTVGKTPRSLSANLHQPLCKKSEESIHIICKPRQTPHGSAPAVHPPAAQQLSSCQTTCGRTPGKGPIRHSRRIFPRQDGDLSLRPPTGIKPCHQPDAVPEHRSNWRKNYKHASGQKTQSLRPWQQTLVDETWYPYDDDLGPRYKATDFSDYDEFD